MPELQKDTEIIVVYDGKCPVCTTYCVGLPQGFRQVDARQQSAERREAEAHGYNLDKGFVVVADGVMHHGAAAMAVLARQRQIMGWRGLLNRLLFRNSALIPYTYAMGKLMRRVALWAKGIPLIAHDVECNIIRHQLGPAWHQLHPNIQRRFEHEPESGEVIEYTGKMEIIRRSRMGWLFAKLTRVIGNPLSPYAGQNVQMNVKLSRSNGYPGIYWQRSYFYEGRNPFVVTSLKCENAQGEMMERVGGGFGMKLNVSAEEGSLHFRSTRYFWSAFGLYIPLPHWLAPGCTHVVHKDMEDGSFTFTISMIHPFLGETFYQHGRFHQRN